MSADYQAFLDAKAPADPPSGMCDPPPLPDCLKPFQAAIVSWALRRGRAAIFAGTGLGKTIQQLVWARAVADYENAQILILTPLAVAEQTVAEAAKFGIESVAYAADQAHATTDIVVSNYERFEKFDIDRFAGIVLDESGLIKSHDGKTRAILTEACRDLPWRLCCTATPAPNDYTELGQHAEFLGVMSAKEMLSMYFVHDGSIRANDHSQGADGWRLKRHATQDFWRWLASWAVVIRHPADLGFDEPGYDLPPLRLHQVTVAAEYKPTAGLLFPMPASTLGDRVRVRRDTAEQRVAAAVEIVRREPSEAWLIWCHLNTEADAIEKLLPGAEQVAGKHNVETKVSRLLGFKKGTPPILVSKPSLAGHGMNWQHCNKMVFVGLTDSFEQTYQAIRRCWRYGQTRPVDVYFVASELEGAVVANLRRKELAFDEMLDAMAGHMRDLMREQVLGGRVASDSYNPTQKMTLPDWLASPKPDDLTEEYLRSILDYEPSSGVWAWLRDGLRFKSGDRAGFSGGPGYRQIRIDGKAYYEHRLAFLYMIGRWPIGVVDHADCDKQNNSWVNLREATLSQNAANSKTKTGNKSGSALKGVSWNAKLEKWQSHIRVNGKSMFLGLFDDEQAAHEAYVSAARAHFGDYARAE